MWYFIIFMLWSKVQEKKWQQVHGSTSEPYTTIASGWSCHLEEEWRAFQNTWRGKKTSYFLVHVLSSDIFFWCSIYSAWLSHFYHFLNAFHPHLRASPPLGRKAGSRNACALKGSKHALNFFRVALPHQEYSMILKSGTIHWIASQWGPGMWAQQERR